MAQEQNISASPSSLLGSSEQMGKLLGIAASGLLVLSTAYDFSFFYALGLSFEDVPTTLADHMRSAIVWAPRVAIYVMCFVMYEMFMRKMEQGLSEEELIQQSKNPKFTRAFRRGPQVLFAVLAILMIVTNTLFTASSHGLYLASIGIWGVLSLQIVQHPRMGARFSMTGGRLFVIVPIIVIFVASVGYSRGDSMLTSTAAQWAVEIKGERGIEKHQIVGLRRFSTSVVVIARGQHVSILPNESIVSAKLIRPLDADSPRVCRWFGFLCQAAKPMP